MSSPIVSFPGPHRLLDRLLDPFGFAQALEGLSLQPSDLPGWSREERLSGAGR